MFPSVPRDDFILGPEVYSGADQRHTSTPSEFHLDALLTLCAVSEPLPQKEDNIVLAYKTGDAGKDLIDGICNFSGTRS
jgi:hypothetical protein